MARSRYSKGKRAYFIDDRTGFKRRYKDIRTEWTGARVAKDEWEPPHPQLTPPRVDPEPQVLYNPRPDNDADGDVTIDYFNWYRHGEKLFVMVGQQILQLDPSVSGETITATLNSPTLENDLTVSGQQISLTQGTAIPVPAVDGRTLNSSLGSFVFEAEENVTGFGVAVTMDDESAELEVSDDPGFEISVALGTGYQVQLLGWGGGTWGSGAWGE